MDTKEKGAKTVLSALEQGLEELKSDRERRVNHLESQHRLIVVNAFIVIVGTLCFLVKVVFDREYIFTGLFIGGVVGYALASVIGDLVKNHLERKLDKKQYEVLQKQGTMIVKAIKKKQKEEKNESVG